MEYIRKNQETCSETTRVVIENGIIEEVEITKGCRGNVEGLMALIKGMEAREAIKRLKGIHCGPRTTSCPDQLAIALEEALGQN